MLTAIDQVKLNNLDQFLSVTIYDNNRIQNVMEYEYMAKFLSAYVLSKLLCYFSMANQIKCVQQKV